MSKNLVIVESPAKAKTIRKYLGDDFVVESSIGHIRDLPSSAKEVPAIYKKEKWSRLGVNVEGDFEPIYVISERRVAQIKSLKKLLKEADTLYLATDEDREGEAIAWHLLEVLKPPKTMDVHRMVFHEITEEAIKEAVASPREIDQNLVNAQEARRILDRLYGYEVSPVLWRKIAGRLSAGRVQSVVKKLLVDKEKERMSFVAAEFAEITVEFGKGDDSFIARLDEVDGKKVAQSIHFDNKGELQKAAVHLKQAEAEELIKDLKSGQIVSINSRPYSRKPLPPLTTSDLQQTAGNRLGMSSALIMSAAQQLYQEGYITYMRTDANNLSKSALEIARRQIVSEFGGDFLSPEVRVYKNKAKNAQEAHEAIRPTGDKFITPKEMASKVAPALSQIYSIIYERTLASQMTDVKGTTTTYKISSEVNQRQLLFSVSGTVIQHHGFRQASQAKARVAKAPAKSDSSDGEEKNAELPSMAESDFVEVLSSAVLPKATTPPSRYTEARLVATLDEIGVGRPSTYASTIKTVLNRGYAWKEGTQIIPTFTAFAVVQLLERHFPDLVDATYTARLEDTLDEISLGKMKTVEWLRDFYKGNGDVIGLSSKVEMEMEKIDAREVSTVPLGVVDGEEVDVRVGKFGPFVSQGDNTASIPPDIPPADMTLERAIAILKVPKEKVIGTDPETGLSIVGLRGRYGQYLRIGTDTELEEKKIDTTDTKTVGLFEGMKLEDLTVELALQLFSLPRTVGVHEEKEIIAANGPFGPYLKHGRESRQLETEGELLTVTLEECVKLFAIPKKHGRSRSTGREIGADPMTSKIISVKNGKFGYYVTDGDVNASLRDTDDPAEIKLERAAELLSDRREKLISEGKPITKAPRQRRAQTSKSSKTSKTSK